MKKIVTLFLSVIILICVFTLVAFATDSDDASAEVYVSIVNKGVFVVTYEKISVKDIDSDGILTVNDALYAAHEAKYTGGTAAGYNYYTGSYGISLGKLWGDTSGSFGYYVNNIMSYSLAQTVADGDHIAAYIYSDTVNYSDVYSFFDINTKEINVGEAVSLTLSAVSFDANWNLVSLPLANAKILINGEDSGVVTDADGKAKITLWSEGTYTVSASSDTTVLVPPVCIVSVKEITPDTNDSVLLTVIIALLSLSGAVCSCYFIKKRVHEK